MRFAVGVARETATTIDALLLETKSGRVAVRGRTFIDCSGDGDLAHFAGVATEKGDAAGALLYPTLMFRVGNVDAGARRRSLAHHPRAHGRRPRPPASSAFRAAARSSGRRSTPTSGGSTSPS